MSTAITEIRTTDRMLRIAEVCDVVGLAPATIYQRIARGEFPVGRKFGTSRQAARRWPESEIHEYLESLRPGSAA